MDRKYPETTEKGILHVFFSVVSDICQVTYLKEKIYVQKLFNGTCRKNSYSRHWKSGSTD